MRSKLISSSPYLGILAQPVPPWQEREANPILARLQLCGMWEVEEEHTAAAAALPHPAGRERMGISGVKSWAWCLKKKQKKRTKHIECLAREDQTEPCHSCDEDKY